MKYSVIFCIILVVVSFHESLQCRCDWGFFELEGKSIHNSICHNRQYILFKADKKSGVPGLSTYHEIDGKVRFTVTLLKMYTNGHEDNFAGGRTVFLDAPMASSLCSYIDFKIGKKYYVNVFGTTKNSKTFDLNGCHYSSSVAVISDVERRIITGELDCPAQEMVLF
ncbi:uncharacterized protein [Mytilus edulis]|uniref:uncharacterized protein n=1 Tax=Mytilus edulis TaxID=6550 RepID=UPI0039F004F5